MLVRVGTFAIVAVLFTALVVAQTSRIAGIVRDPSGNPLPGVSVEIRSPALPGSTRVTVTGRDGRYAFTSLPAGTYDVTFALGGFTTLVRSGVVLANGSALPVDVELRVGRLEEGVVVTGEAPAVDVQQSRREGGPERPQPVPVPVSPQPAATPSAIAPGGVAGGVVGGYAGPAGGGAFAPPPRYDPYFVRPGRPNTESYESTVENAFRRVADDPLSTFSIDVDTASYANVRRFLHAGALPPRDAVRIEEMINYFDFSYPKPRDAAPFSVTTELVVSPWNPQHRLALIGLQGRDSFDDDRTPRNLVFLIDVSGSMASDDKLPLVRNGMRMLADTLQPRDRVAIVVYAGHSGVVLPSTTGDRKDVIHRAIERLQPGGSTNGAAGIKLAYELARQQFVPGGVNRVILATDGDFNVGVTSREELMTLIEHERRSGVYLTVLGVGTGNLKDGTMEMLADKGNGNYAYLDSLQEAQRVLVHEAASTLVAIAKDVKIQIEFNPQTVHAYRLIGYENRLLRAEDFNDDRKDAGEIGEGHSVTALYEIVPVGADVPGPSVDPLKYQETSPGARPAASPANRQYADELMTVKLRYKAPDAETSRLITTVVRNRPQAMTSNVGFASAVAELGMLLRGSTYAATASFDAVIARARTYRGEDPDGYRSELIKLAEVARGLRALR
jgi:Ca-activated chloride channel family protein